MTAPAEAPAPHWLAFPCCSPGFTHFRLADDGQTLTCTRSGGYTGCGHTLTLNDLPAPTPGDVLALQADDCTTVLEDLPTDRTALHGSVLVYGIDPHATFTHRSGSNGWPRTFTARELDDYLNRICVWQHFTRTAALLAAARNGEETHESGYGLKTTLTRN